MHDEYHMDKIIPMAANLIMVFYKNDQGRVIVKFLHNEKEIRLPIDSQFDPYYDWDKVKKINVPFSHHFPPPGLRKLRNRLKLFPLYKWSKIISEKPPVP